MHANVGTTDRVIRIGLALILFAVFFAVPGPLHWIGLIGVVPLLTAFVGFCPLYTLLGVSTGDAKT